MDIDVESQMMGGSICIADRLALYHTIIIFLSLNKSLALAQSKSSLLAPGTFLMGVEQSVASNLGVFSTNTEGFCVDQFLAKLN